LLDNTRAQAQALQQKLGDAYRVFVCMRYWHPMAQEIVRDVAAYAPDGVILLGLYPQFSTTTTDSAFKDWERSAEKAGFTAPTKKICCWAQEPGFITASSRLVRAAVDEARNKLSGRPARLLFSAHGLPEKIIAAGDPYQAQCEATASALLAAMGGYEDSILCYQSRVGPLRWIGPSTEEEIRRAGRDGVGVVIYPLAFVSEHVETLVELDIEYRHLAQQSGVPVYVRAPTVMTQPEFIEGLSRLVIQAPTDSRETCGPGSCGPSYSACPCSKREAA
ncbi:MAG TPA: ferrochelatase, partial [Alphaproteobacteria bacterium]|nr:ferrochelatase [Alphaproteobacteria bacterium]